MKEWISTILITMKKNSLLLSKVARKLQVDLFMYLKSDLKTLRPPIYGG